MPSWDTSNPGDNDLISQYPANERAQRAAVEDIFGIDHHEEDDGDQGYHELVTFMTQPGDPATYATGGRLFIKLVDGKRQLFFKDSEGNVIQFTDNGQSFVGKVNIITPDNPTSHMAKASENGGLLIFDSADDCTLTLPEQGTEALAAGWYLLAKNVGGGNLTLATEGTDTLEGVSLVQTPDQPVTVILEDDSDPNAYSVLGNQWIPTYITDDTLTAPPGVTPAKGAIFILAGNGSGAWAGGTVGDFAIHLGSDAYTLLDNPLSAEGSGYLYRIVKSGYVELVFIDSFGTKTQLTRQGTPNSPEILRLVKQDGDPADESEIAKIYAKDNGSGVVEPYAMDDAGNVSRLMQAGVGNLIHAEKDSGDSPSFSVTFPETGNYWLEVQMNCYSNSRTVEGDEVYALRVDAATVDSVTVSKQGDTSSAHRDFAYVSPTIGGQAAITAGTRTVEIATSGDDVFTIRECYLKVYKVAD